MKTVYNYPLVVTGKQIISVPKLNGASTFKDQFLSVAYRGADGISMWCLVDDDAPSRDVEICIVGTGRVVDPELSKDNYLGTCIMYGGGLVWHIFLVEGK